MRYVMMLFICDVMDCEARIEHMVEISPDTYTGRMAGIDRWAFPDGWGNRRRRELTTKTRARCDDLTYCPEHFDKEGLP